MTFKTIKKCKVKDIFYCAEKVNTDCWIRSGRFIYRVIHARPSLYDEQVILHIKSHNSIGLDVMGSDINFNYSEQIELVKPLKEVLLEL